MAQLYKITFQELGHEAVDAKATAQSLLSLCFAVVFAVDCPPD